MLFLIRGEHINIASVLSEFSLSLFVVIQFCIATTHACRRIIAEFVSSFDNGVNEMYSWVSSAYK